MIKRIILMAVAALSLGLFTLAGYQPASAQFKNEACQGIAETTGRTCDESAGGVGGLLTTMINIFSLIVGVVAIIMLIVGGIKYITSQGDAGALTMARNTVIYALVGLVIVALAQTIVRFVLDKTT